MIPQLSEEQHVVACMLSHRVKKNHDITLTGAAGTGKTRCLIEVARKTGAMVLTPTNRAAKILIERGQPAITIHSAIYQPLVVTLREQIDALTRAIDAAEKDGEKVPQLKRQRTLAAKQLDACPDDFDLKFTFRPTNLLNRMHVIVDESSMVPADVVEDIRCSQIGGLLRVGDTNQLPPVKAEACFQSEDHDYDLEEQHRSDGSVLRIANAILDGGPSHAWTHALQSPDVYTRGKHDGIDYASMTDPDALILAWRNNTVDRLNREARQYLQRYNNLPEEGDKLVSRSRNKAIDEHGIEIMVHNGEHVQVVSVHGYEDRAVYRGPNASVEKCVTLRIKLENDSIVTTYAPCADFPDWSKHAKWRYGYASTVHTAQGGEWRRVHVIDEFHSAAYWMRKKCDYDRWLYTAVTRASQELRMSR